MAPQPVHERFERSYIPEPNTGCWLWTRYVTSDGYGRLKVSRAMRLAHRVSWEIYRGPIPEGMQIDHICRMRGCVNPDHLRVVTHRTNTLENSFSESAKNTAKTHCPRGHPYSGDNLYVSPDSRRYCRTCHRAQDKAWWAAKTNKARAGKEAQTSNQR